MALCTQCGAPATSTRYCQSCGVERHQPENSSAPQISSQESAPVAAAQAAETWDPAQRYAQPGAAAGRRRRRRVAAGTAVALLAAAALLGLHARSSGRPGLVRAARTATRATPSAAPGVVSRSSSAPPALAPGAQTAPPAGWPQQAGYLASLLPLDGTGTVPVYAGPSSSAFDRVGAGRADQQVTVLCVSYGDRFHALGSNGRRWDFTSLGWLPDRLVRADGAGLASVSCRGNSMSPARSTERGAAPPSPLLGPFAVLADGQLAVRSGPAEGDVAVGVLRSGDLVTLVCAQRTGVTAAPPGRLASSGGNDQWDRIDTPVAGWVPDSYVASGSNGSSASAC